MTFRLLMPKKSSYLLHIGSTRKPFWNPKIDPKLIDLTPIRQVNVTFALRLRW